MKTIKLAGLKTDWILTMPNWLFYFVCRWVVITSKGAASENAGRTFTLVYFDETGEIKWNKKP